MTLHVDVDPCDYGFSPDALGRVTPFFDRYVEEGKLPGWQATIARGGQLLWSAKGGLRDREKGLAVVDDTIWRIYSMTKPVTALATMILHDEGRFDLNDDVGQWIEALREPRVWTGGSAEEPETEAAVGPVRVHHLLTHTSGLTYGFTRLHPVDQIYRNKGYDFAWPRGATTDEAIDAWATSPLVFQPGTGWNYSVSYDVLGRLIEIWSGQTLDNFVKERILDPLGLVDTEWWCPPKKQDRLAMLYFASEGRAHVMHDLADYSLRPPRILGGGGGLLSTAADYQRFMNMLWGGGELDGVRVVSSRSIELMTSNHLPDDVDLETFAKDSWSEVEFAGVGYGLGFSVVTDRRKNKTTASEGTFAWGGAASTAFWVDPVEDLTVAFYTQVIPSGTYPIRREFQRLVYGALTD